MLQELATHAPMMIRVPGLTDKGMRSMSYTSHVDLFPTLAEIAAVCATKASMHRALQARNLKENFH